MTQQTATMMFLFSPVRVVCDLEVTRLNSSSHTFPLLPQALPLPCQATTPAASDYWLQCRALREQKASERQHHSIR